MEDQEGEIKKIAKRLNLMEARLGRLESLLVQRNENSELLLTDLAIPEEGTSLSSEKLNEEDRGIEVRIGRFGLAWLGNIVLLFGITFLAQNLMNLGSYFLATLTGYISAALVFFLAMYLSKKNTHLASVLRINSQLLLYYTTLRLHFFSDRLVISNHEIALGFLLALVALQAWLAIKDRSQAFGALSVVFALTTGIVSNSTHFMLFMILLSGTGSVFYYYRFKWEALLVITIILAYISFFIWFLGNPVMGDAIKIMTEHKLGIVYFFVLGAIFSGVLLLRNRDLSSTEFLIVVTFVNGILFTILLTFIVMGLFSKNYVGLFTVISSCCLGYSIFLHSKSDWNFGSAFYSLYGFMAMSISLYGFFGFPGVYLLLSVQSLIVVSVALWFRNRLIIIMNSLLFLTILLIYLFTSKSVNGVNFSFAMISLISARIINWKKSRLQIETDLLRNLYMIEGFFMMLFALFHAIPKQFITLSWTIAALLYFLIGLILKNIKYRYLALGTMICAAIYLFIIDLANIEILFRILALLFLSAISLGISMYYTNHIKHSDN